MNERKHVEWLPVFTIRKLCGFQLFFLHDFSPHNWLIFYLLSVVCFLFEFEFPQQHPVVSLPKRSCLSCLVSLVSLDLPLCVYIASSLYVLFLKSCTCFSSMPELCFPRVSLHFYFFFLIRNPNFLVCLFFPFTSQSCFAVFRLKKSLPVVRFMNLELPLISIPWCLWPHLRMFPR